MQLQIDFDKYENDIPTLVVSQRMMGVFETRTRILNVIQGEEAMELYKRLTEIRNNGTPNN